MTSQALHAAILLSAIGGAIAALCLRDVVKIAWQAFFTWRLEREFEFSNEAFRRCKHDKGTVMVDVGVPAEKCLTCWGLRYPGGQSPIPFVGGNEWHPNSAAPPGVRQPFWPRPRNQPGAR